MIAQGKCNDSTEITYNKLTVISYLSMLFLLPFNNQEVEVCESLQVEDFPTLSEEEVIAPVFICS